MSVVYIVNALELRNHFLTDHQRSEWSGVVKCNILPIIQFRPFSFNGVRNLSSCPRCS